MTWSMNEIEALARKAARGRGMSWGLAEEAGKATRRLCEAGLNGAPLLADLLDATDGAAHRDIAPIPKGGTWHAGGRALCPIATGAFLCDSAASLTVGKAIRLGRIAFPVFLIPFAQSACRQLDRPIDLRWADACVTVHARGFNLEGPPMALDSACTQEVICRATQTDADPREATQTRRADVPGDVIDRLSRYAARTFCPDTEESRLSGAGAGLADND